MKSTSTIDYYDGNDNFIIEFKNTSISVTSRRILLIQSQIRFLGELDRQSYTGIKSYL